MNALGAIQTGLNFIRKYIGDRGIETSHSNFELLQHWAKGHDRAVEDAFSTEINKPYVEFFLPYLTGQKEYVLPAGIGGVYSIETTAPRDGTGTTVTDRLVTGIVPTYSRDDVRGPNWVYNKPLLKFDDSPSTDGLLKITFMPCALDYLHLGRITDTHTQVLDTNYANSFVVTIIGASGNYKLWWKGEQTANISTSDNAATIKGIIEALTDITTVNVSVLSGSGVLYVAITFVSPAGYQPPFVVSQEITGATITVDAGYTDDYPQLTETTLKLSSLAGSTEIGAFDPRPNGYIGGRIRGLGGGVPYGYSDFVWQERDIIEYNPATRVITLSSPFDFTWYGDATHQIVYEILPMGEEALLHLGCIEAARRIHILSRNFEAAQFIKTELYDIERATIRRTFAGRNRAHPNMPTPKRYLKGSDQIGGTVYNPVSIVGDRATF